MASYSESSGEPEREGTDVLGAEPGGTDVLGPEPG